MIHSLENLNLLVLLVHCWGGFKTVWGVGRDKKFVSSEISFVRCAPSSCTSIWDHYYLMYSWMISVRFLIGLSPSCLLTTWNCTGMFCRTWMSGALQVDLMVLNKKTNDNGRQLNQVKCKMITSKPRCLTEVNTLLMMLYLRMLNSGIILDSC